MNGLSWALVAAAAAVGALHTMAPDHWMPFAALARARGWTPLRATRTTVVCGLGHVTVSAVLGIAALYVGLEVMKLIGSRLEGLATYLLMAFGTLYMIWGLHRSFRRDPMAVLHAHDHHHAHGQSDHDHGLTEWSLFVLFCLDPCVAVIPVIVAATSAGWTALLVVVLAYEIATIATMVVLVTAAHVGTRAVRVTWVDRHGDAVAGALIVCVGAAMVALGL